MSLLLGQLVYTSFPMVGFQSLTSEQVPRSIQQAFIQHVAHRRWDAYNPPKVGYRAAYLYQVTLEHTLFGWLYNDGLDDLGRSHVPYFVCYHLAEQLGTDQLETIFTFLHGGPVAILDRQSFPLSLETVAVPDLWNYQPTCVGVAIPAEVRDRAYTALEQERLLDLFVPADQPEIITKLNEHIYKQQVDLSVCSADQARSSKASAVILSAGTVAIETQVLTPYQGDGRLHSDLEKTLIELIGPIAPTLLQQVSQQVATDQELIANLVLHLPSHQQTEFERRAISFLQQPAPQPEKSCVVNQAFIGHCEQELAKIIGPIAAFVVQQVLQSDPQASPAEFVENLIAEIPNRQKAEQFRLDQVIPLTPGLIHVECPETTIFSYLTD